MLSIFFAVCAATLYGGADFLGGLASRRSAVMPVMIFSQLAGSCMLVVILPWLPGASASITDLLWGTVAGVGLGVGLMQLYQGLALGKMSLVAPLTAVLAVLVSALVGVLGGDRLSPAAFAGVALAVVAIILISQDGASKTESEGDAARSPRTLAIALSAGLLIGVFFAALKQSSASSGSVAAACSSSHGAGSARRNRAVAAIIPSGWARRRLADCPRWSTRYLGERALRFRRAPWDVDDCGDIDLVISGKHHYSRPLRPRRAPQADSDRRPFLRRNRSRAHWRGLNRRLRVSPCRDLLCSVFALEM